MLVSIWQTWLTNKKLSVVEVFIIIDGRIVKLLKGKLIFSPTEIPLFSNAPRLARLPCAIPGPPVIMPKPSSVNLAAIRRANCNVDDFLYTGLNQNWNHTVQRLFIVSNPSTNSDNTLKHGPPFHPSDDSTVHWPHKPGNWKLTTTISWQSANWSGTCKPEILLMKSLSSVVSIVGKF